MESPSLINKESFILGTIVLFIVNSYTTKASYDTSFIIGTTQTQLSKHTWIGKACRNSLSWHFTASASYILRLLNTIIWKFCMTTTPSITSSKLQSSSLLSSGWGPLARRRLALSNLDKKENKFPGFSVSLYWPTGSAAPGVTASKSKRARRKRQHKHATVSATTKITSLPAPRQSHQWLPVQLKSTQTLSTQDLAYLTNMKTLQYRILILMFLPLPEIVLLWI